MNNGITEYQRRCWTTYKQELGLADNYTYLYGNPVKVHVPVDTATNGLMIIGAYPTAHFQTIKSIPDVPVEDHLYPLGAEVTSVIHQCSLEKATEMIKPEPIQKTIHNKTYTFFAVPHPGILMRNTEGSEKWRGVLKDQIIPVVKEFL